MESIVAKAVAETKEEERNPSIQIEKLSIEKIIDM